MRVNCSLNQNNVFNWKYDLMLINLFYFFSFSLKSQDDKGLDVHVSLAISVCFKLNSDCDTVILLDNVKLPKPFCDWTPSFTIPGEYS